MCGIAGIMANHPVDSAALTQAADAIAHRGPDDAGVWLSADGKVGFAHRRLSIVDLSPAGHQPMASAGGRYMLVYNGEIYNHAVIRAELDQAGVTAWRGHSDTETLLAAIERWGLPATLRRASGMFALALWDRETATLSLARDRIGEKPLYFGWQHGSIVFGSELKALRCLPGFVATVDPEALALYFRYNYVPGPWSILQHTFKLPPGTVLTLGAEAIGHCPPAPPTAGDHGPGWRCESYWSLAAVADAGLRDRITDPDAAIAAVEGALSAAVGLQTVADVPVGAFLSGGIDSSLIVSLMRGVAGHNVRTFTIGFDDVRFNEANHAKAVAEHLGTDHTELYVTPSETIDVVPRLAAMYDEPFADSSQIPTFLVSQLARQSVTVSLSGDAGDELFGGYNRYIYAERLWRRFANVPGPARRAAGWAIGAVPAGAWDRLARLPGIPRIGMLGNKAMKVGRMLRADDGMRGVFRSFIEEWHDGLPMRAGSYRDVSARTMPPPPAGLSVEEQMMFWDMQNYLPGDILAKVDRAAMATSLETRVPFLDRDVIELAARIDPALKVRGNDGKWVLRQILYKHVPRALIDRPKTGFGIPVGQWLRGPLRDWAEALLAGDVLDSDSLLDAALIRRRWDQHLRGSHDWTQGLWSILMYQAWKRDWA